MPTRRLPRTDSERDAALRNAKTRKDVIPPPAVIPFTANTITRLDALQPVYRSKILAVNNAKNAQTALTQTVESARKTGVYLIHDFIETLNRSIRRGLLTPSARTFYGIAVTDETLPRITSESELTTWGLNLAEGEAARIAAGGAPIPFPTIAQVTAGITAFNNANGLQANAKETYDAAQEALAAENSEADKLILKMWNEIEAAFDEGDKASMRRKAREWGVVYVPNAGEAPSPDDYSIIGKVTDTVTGAALEDANVYVGETNSAYQTDSQGNYYIPVLTPGNYHLTFLHNGYDNVNKEVTVTAGVLATLNAQLAVATTGKIHGTVLQGGMVQPATVTAGGQSTNTGAGGEYEIQNLPAGEQEVKAWLNSNPGNQQTQTVTIIAGGSTDVDFEF